MTTANSRTGPGVTQELLIEGAGCASCVRKIETALANVDGVERGADEFPLRTVAVTGSAFTADLVKAVENAGYRATPAAGSETDLLEEKEQADQRLLPPFVARYLDCPRARYSADAVRHGRAVICRFTRKLRGGGGCCFAC
ncbi:MAG: cation transporter [Cellvibrionaceae bacterium]|nr:cation transporter [Cellvibrionaceae bacterium]